MSTQNFLVLVAASCAAACSTNTTAVPETVTPSALRQVQLGMTSTEVLTLLGPPVSTNERANGGSERILEYARPSRGYAYPMIWVRLRNDSVVEVYAKRYFLWGKDDEAIFVRSESVPQAWESDDFVETLGRPE